LNRGHDASFDCIYIGRECLGKAVAINPKKAMFVGRKNGGSARRRGLCLLVFSIFSVTHVA